MCLDGDSFETIRSVYVIIDRVKYQFTSVSEASDVLFKCYHVINITYPPQCAHILQLIQICVYKIHTPYDKVFPNLIDILTQF